MNVSETPTMTKQEKQQAAAAIVIEVLELLKSKNLTRRGASQVVLRAQTVLQDDKEAVVRVTPVCVPEILEWNFCLPTYVNQHEPEPSPPQ